MSKTRKELVKAVEEAEKAKLKSKKAYYEAEIVYDKDLKAVEETCNALKEFDKIIKMKTIKEAIKALKEFDKELSNEEA